MIRPSADDSQAFLTRRRWLQRAGGGFGLIGLAGIAPDGEGLLGAASAAADASLNPMAARPGHFPARAKRVIWVFTNGGPSQVDTWEYKPALERWHGKSMREFDPSFKNTTGFFKNQVGALMKSPFRFTPRGESRQDGLGDLPEPGPARRQDGVPALGLHRVEQPFAGPVHDQHGDAAHGLPVRRLVGDLRPGQRGR